MQKLLSLKPGDKHDLSRAPSSFSSQIQKAQMFSNNDGKHHHIVLRIPKSKLKHSPSITGLSVFGKAEYEVLVGDYDFTHVKTFTKPYYDKQFKEKYDITYIYLD